MSDQYESEASSTSEYEPTPPPSQRARATQSTVNSDTPPNDDDDSDTASGESEPEVRQQTRVPPRARKGKAKGDEDDDTDIDDFPQQDDVIFREFAEKIVAMAQDLARQNSQYTTKEILSRALKITTATSKRLRFNKVSAWQVAMREESGLVDKTLLQPVAGKGYQGRKGFDGKYSKHVSEEYKDTEKRLAWSKRATELNADAGVGTLESLHTTQKTGLKRLSNYLHELTNNEVHVILMACPTKAKPLFFTSAGFGAAYYKLIVASGRSHDEFMTACEGGGLLKQAVSATNSGYDGCLGRNKLRAEIVILLKELINSKLPKEGFVNNIPRSRLDDFLKERKLKWKAPPDFGATQEEITKYLLLELLGPMKKIHEALKAKTLTLVKG